MIEGQVDDALLEARLLEVGKRLAGALPAGTRNPLKAADDKAMELASHDAELKAALFRFVDVVPGVPLARRPRAPPDGLPRRGRRAAAAGRGRDADGRLARRAAPRSAPPRRPASSTWRTASSSASRPRPRCGTLRDLWRGGVASSVDLLGEATVTQGEAAALRRALRRRAGHDLRRGARLARAAARSSATAPARCRARTCPSRSPRSRRCCAPTPPSAASATPPTGCAACCAGARALGAHLHIDMESLDSRDAVARAGARAARRAGVPRRAVGRDGAAGLPARLAGDARHRAGLDRRRRRRARAPADRAAGQGRLLGPRDRRGRASTAGTRRCSRSRPTPTATSRR